MQDLDDLNFEIVQDDEEKEQKEGAEYEIQQQLTLNYHNLNNLQKEQQALCTELKQLYVCCTRPKKRLIFYDENQEAREVMMNFWKDINVIDIIDEKMIQQYSHVEDQKELSEEQRILFEKI